MKHSYESVIAQALGIAEATILEEIATRIDYKYSLTNNGGTITNKPALLRFFDEFTDESLTTAMEKLQEMDALKFNLEDFKSDRDVELIVEPNLYYIITH